MKLWKNNLLLFGSKVHKVTYETLIHFSVIIIILSLCTISICATYLLLISGIDSCLAKIVAIQHRDTSRKYMIPLWALSKHSVKGISK